jgi:glycosyltransferase involved in cell wall biosynthesis
VILPPGSLVHDVVAPFHVHDVVALVTLLLHGAASTSVITRWSESMIIDRSDRNAIPWVPCDTNHGSAPKGMISPRVSIGFPVYNGEKYAGLALDSLLQQDFEEFEIIISDNASTDRTGDICRDYARMDARIRYYRNDSNIGSAPNYEKVFRSARGLYFKWQAHDDVVHKGFLTRCVEAIENAGPSAVLVYPHCELIDDAGKILGSVAEHVGTRSPKAHKRVAVIARNVSYGSALNGLIRSNVLQRTQLSRSASYWDLALLAELALFGEIVEVPEVLMQQRTHAGNALALCSVEQEGKKCNVPDKASKRARKALLLWENPANAAKRVFLPTWEEQVWQILQRVYHAPLSKHERWRCIMTVLVNWYVRRLRTLGGCYKRRLLSSMPQRSSGPCS